MHIAICDDTISDRKHLERLLHRESDRRLKEGHVLYIDAYGSDESLLTSPMLYELFFIDMTKDGSNGMETARKLIAHGVTARIILCCSTIPYREEISVPDSISFIDKPYNPTVLSTLITDCLNKDIRKPALELRGQYETRYVHEEEIAYIIPSQSTVTVHFTDSTSFIVLGTIEQLAHPLSAFPFFLFVHKNYIINILFLESVSGRQAIMKNKERVPLYPFDRKGILSALEHLKHS